MSKEICPMCAEEVCICGEAYKGLGASQLEILIPILVQQYENTPEYHESMARHVNIYGSARRNLQRNYQPFPLEHRGIDSRDYFGSHQSQAAKDESEVGLRYEMVIVGMVAYHAGTGGPITAVSEQEMGSGLRYKIIDVDTQFGHRRYAVGGVEGKVTWPSVGDTPYMSIDIMDLNLQLPDGMRQTLAAHLNGNGHRFVHRKLAVFFGPDKCGLSEGLDLGHPPYGFGNEGRTSSARQEMFTAGQVMSAHVMGAGVDRLDGRVSLTNIGRVFRRPGPTTGLFTASDMMKYRRLSPGAKFQFLEGAGADFVGEWVVTGFQLFDEDQGPKLQVASIVATRGDQSVTFYTSFSVDQVDEKMVPFVSMEHIEILPDSWDIVEDPCLSEFKALGVGKTMGIAHLPPDVKLEIVEVEWRQQNYGLVNPERYIAIVKLSIPAELRQPGDDQEFFTFWTGNISPMNVMFVPGVTEHMPLSSIISHE
jgi:hypothetical protein